jgi:hypothetical protein
MARSFTDSCIMSFVYWVYDLGCGNETISGYVGVTEDPHRRFHDLCASGTVPRHAKMTVLLEGDRTECLAMEKKLRPKRNIGWNKATGGIATAPIKHGLTPRSSGRFEGFWS